LPRHYSPRVALQLLQPGDPLPRPRLDERIGLLLFMERQGTEGYAAIEVLSPNGNLVEAAANLFAALRRLDSVKLDRVVIESVPESGIGRAIMDRLRRASALPSSF
jgi:L-threonylcarbamoyladenylate synthase